MFLADGTAAGVLVGWFHRPHVSSEEEVMRFALYARLAGIALAKERMVEEVRRAMARARAEAEQAEVLRLSRFQAVTEAFSRALTLTEVARAVLDLGLPAVGALSGTVHLLLADGGDVQLAAAVGLDSSAEEELRRLPREANTPGT